MQGEETKIKIKILKSKLLELSLLGSFLIAILSSCENREAYYKFQELENADWAIDKVLFFEIDSNDVEQGVPYDIAIEVTNNVDYPYQNLWLFGEYNTDDSTTVDSKDEFILADEFGRWLGAGFASLYQSSHIMKESVTFNEPRNYRIGIRHGMRDTTLHGIERVGLKISRTQ